VIFYILNINSILICFSGCVKRLNVKKARMMESDGTNLIDLRPRNRGNAYNNPTTSGWAKEDEKILIDHLVQPTDSLYKIGLQYSVPISEIKRVNNIVAEQDFHALKFVRVPVTRLRQQFLNEKRAMQDADPPIIDISSPSVAPNVSISDKINLLGDSTDEEENSSDSSAKSAIDAILNKADTTVAQCRNQLPSPNLESGAFHFVNASAPDNAIKGTWMLVLGVVVMFVIIPLFLTMLEENHEQHHIHHHTSTLA